jgi:hypothetical protein
LPAVQQGWLMYLRKVQPRGRGRKQVYWELVESYRTAKGSRQRTVAYLGKLGSRQVSGWRKLSDQLSGAAPPLPGLFDGGGEIVRRVGGDGNGRAGLR